MTRRDALKTVFATHLENKDAVSVFGVLKTCGIVCYLAGGGDKLVVVRQGKILTDMDADQLADLAEEGCRKGWRN